MTWTKTGTLPATVVTDANVATQVTSGTLTREALTGITGLVNIKTFGAVGDGVTDDTAAIQAAHTAAAALGVRTLVLYPAGEYAVNGVNTSQSNHSNRWIGGGIKPSSGDNVWMSKDCAIKVISNGSPGYAAFYLGPDVDKVTITGGNIVGDRATHDYTTDTTYPTHEFGFGVACRGAQDVTIDGVKITGMTGDCVFAGSVGAVDDLDPTYNPSSGRIINCYLDGARRNNISLVANDHWLVDNNTIGRAGYNDGIHDGTAPRAGIDLEFGSNQAVKNIDIRNNRFVGNVTASVEAFNSNGVHIESNFMDSPIIMGAHINNNCTIRGNLVMNTADTTSNGIALSGGSTGQNNILVSDNMVIGFNQGIFLTGNGVTCTDNYVTQFTTAGIVGYLASDVSILGNHVADPVPGGVASGILFKSPATLVTPRIEAIGNRISNCYFGMNWTQAATGITAKGNTITKGFTAFNVGTSCAAVIEDNLTDLPGHAAGQGSDVVTTSTSKVALIKNTFRNSSSPSVAAVSGGSGGTSRIIGNKIVNTTSTIGMTCVGGTHEIVDNTFSTSIASGALYAIQITGAAVNCLVTGNKAWHNGASPWSRLVKSDAATGTPATVISDNTFLSGTVVATPHASDIIGPNIASNGLVSPKRLLAITDTATLTIDASSYDAAKVTALAQAMTVAAPTGTPSSMQPLIIRIKDAGTAKGLTWNSVFRAIGVTLPTTTVVSKTVYVGAIWNSDAAKWDCIAVAQEA